MDKKYTKLKDLVGQSFTVKKVWGFKWKKWEIDEGRMVSAEKYFDGAQKKWAIETDHGELDVSEHQFGMMLAAYYSGEGSVLVGKTFDVKSNGKDGQEIRYFINPQRGGSKQAPSKPQKEVVVTDIQDEAVDLSDIPF